MDIELVDLLACPVCGGDLNVMVVEQDSEIKEGLLKCVCGREYKIENYIPKFVDE